MSSRRATARPRRKTGSRSPSAYRRRAHSSRSTCLVSRRTRRTPRTRSNSSTTSCGRRSSRRSATRCPIRTRTWRRRRWSNRKSATAPASIPRKRSRSCSMSTCRRRATTSAPAPAPGTGSRPASNSRISRGTMPLLEIREVSKNFGTVAAVDRVSLSVEHGELFALLGPSGCGKTTLLRLIAGFELPDRGRIVIDGSDVTGVPPYRRPVNMMFQSYALFPHLDVGGNVAFGLKQEGMERRRREARVAEMLALVQMSDYARRRPHELSGGQKQRVALARALAKMPKLLLLDEPLAALDRKLREETRLELVGIQERVGTSFVFVTHDQEEALGMASRIAVMERGRVAQIGGAAEIYERPNSRFVADFVGAVNLFDGVLVAGFNMLSLGVRGIEAALPLAEAIDLPEGAEATLAVRPEKLRLSAVQPEGIGIAATVSSGGYQGGVSIVHLTAIPGQVLKAQMTSASAAAFNRG